MSGQRTNAGYPIRLVLFTLTFALISMAPVRSRAQGCSLCKDATAGSAPHAREGLRKGILVLGLPAGAIFLTILVVARKMQPREPES
jgi:hypothetical protein